MEKKLKLYNTSIKSIDEENKTIRFRISDDSIDRYGEKVDQSWNLKNFLKNPIMLWNHKNWDVEPEDVLGTWSDIKTESDGTYATAKFDVDINPKALIVFQQYVKRTLRAVSVGFIPHSLEFDDDVPVLKDNELLEVSCVPIPANANAVALALKDGSLNRKDAQWMLRSMTEAVTSLEDQLKKNAPDNGQEHNVEELKTDLKSALELLTQLGEKVTAIDGDVKAINTELTDVKSAVADLKTVAEEKVEEQEEQEEDGGSQNQETPPAKGGEDDQPGAGEDEFNEDAELTPKIQAQIDAEFENIDEAQDQ